MSESHAEVLIVGAGLSGLACARALRRAGLQPLVVEASDGVGGRVRTDFVDGFRLDRGFQVLLKAYPTAQSELDYERLDLRSFEPGALIRLDGAFHRVGDPFRRPASALSTLRAPIGTLADKRRVAYLALRLRRKPLPAIWNAPESSTRDHLLDLGFTSRMVDSFFRPFMGGVFLDPLLETSSRMFEFVFRMFGEDDVAVPAEGMGRLSDQVAADLPPDALELETPVRSVHAGGAVLEGGASVLAQAVVVATDGPEARRLLGLEDVPGYRRALCLYYSTDAPPVPDGILVLDGEGTGPVTNLAVMSQVSPDYAPAGRELVSATVLGDDMGDADVRARVRRQLTDWFGARVSEWEEVGAYRIEVGLPDQSLRAGGVRDRPIRTPGGVFVCGDHRRHGSIEGALVSGLAAADAVCQDLGVRA
jgi:phytoene dehydrogenase-like protein